MNYQTAVLPIGIKFPIFPRFPVVDTVANRYVVACANSQTQRNHMEIIYHDSVADAALDYVFNNLGEYTYGQVNKLNSLSDIKSKLATFGLFINVIKI